MRPFDSKDTQADWAGYKADRRSTSGFVFSLSNGAISWSSKKQPTVALSSSKAEYRGATIAACEVVGLKRILKDLWAFPLRMSWMNSSNIRRWGT